MKKYNFRLRKPLKKNEHKYISHSGKLRRYQPKNFKKWKLNKEYNKYIKAWEFIEEIKYYRYTKVMLWTNSGEEKYKGLMIQTNIFSKIKLNIDDVKKEINALHKEVKDYYDTTNYFEDEETKLLSYRRIGFEEQEISKEEYKEEEKISYIIYIDIKEETIKLIKTIFHN